MAFNRVDRMMLAAGLLLSAFFVATIHLGAELIEKEAENAALKQAILGPAEKVVELTDGSKFKAVEVAGRYFLIAEFQGVALGAERDTTCDTYIEKPEGRREYGVRFNCP